MAKKSPSIEMAEGDVQVIKIVGDIYPWTGQDFRYALMEADESVPLAVYVSGDGGDVGAAWEMYNAVKEYGGEIRCRVGAKCFSAMTLLLCAFETVECYNNSLFMIHKPMHTGGGNVDELEAKVKQLKELTPAIVKAYAEKMGMSNEQVEALWANGEVWWNATSAKKHGLVNAVVKPGPSMQAESVMTAEDLDRLQSNRKVPEPVLMQARKAVEQANKPELNMKKVLMLASALQVGNKEFNLNGVEDESVMMDRAIAESQRQANELVEMRVKVKTLTEEKKTLEEKIEAEKTGTVMKLIDDCVEDGRIQKEQKEHYVAMAKTAPESVTAILGSIKPRETFAARLNGGTGADKKITEEKAGWSFMQFSEKDSAGLVRLQKDNPDLYAKMRKAPTTPLNEIE